MPFLLFSTATCSPEASCWSPCLSCASVFWREICCYSLKDSVGCCRRPSNTDAADVTPKFWIQCSVTPILMTVWPSELCRLDQKDFVLFITLRHVLKYPPKEKACCGWRVQSMVLVLVFDRFRGFRALPGADFENIWPFLHCTKNDRK